jgi:DNA-directed RNA polymerase subunit M/transcription elongation factor TFIIS
MEPRDVMRTMFYTTLAAALSSVGPLPGSVGPLPGSAQLLQLAGEIETACYNAVIRQCKQSENPPRRQWNSPVFVDAYSTRCGTVQRVLRTDTEPSMRYGARVAEALIAGRLAPATLGELTERDLCPNATIAERAEIAHRMSQRIAKKESIMFKCPHCHDRRCTYEQVQRRALDEAPDFNCVCLGCGRAFNGR